MYDKGQLPCIRLGSRSAHEMGHVPHSESLCSSNQQLKEVGCWALTIVGNAIVLIHIIKTLMEVGSGYYVIGHSMVGYSQLLLNHSVSALH